METRSPYPSVTATQAVLVPVQGPPTAVPYDKSRGDSAWLKVMQGAVQGYIETVPLPLFPSLVMVANEEGRLMDIPHNPVASLLAEQYIVGPVLLVTWAMLQGEDADEPC